MLYHSQDITTQYWLTPLLCYIYKNPNEQVTDYSAFLRHLDNNMFGVKSKEQETLIKRSRTFMDSSCRVSHTSQNADVLKDILATEKGTVFPHYWFYKLEYVLWYLSQQTNLEPKKEDWKKFRVTSKNLIEHIAHKPH